MPAGQKPLVIPPSAGSDPPSSTAPPPPTLSSLSSSQYKVCADCELRIPREQAIIFHGAETCLVVCSDCRWNRLSMDPLAPPATAGALAGIGARADTAPRPPHASPSHGSDSSIDSASTSPSPDTPPQELALPLSWPFPQSLHAQPPTQVTLQDRVPSTSTTTGRCRLPPTPAPTPFHHPIIPCILPDPPSASSSTRASQPTPRPGSYQKNPDHTERQTQYRHRTEPSPYTDITRLRVKRTGKYCLYPGSTFRGVQKSGRSDYDVTVTILDVDLSTSFLCGYLEIRGLTEDWPELTTYFDAEIVGAQYSFLTRGWGATHENDLNHWGKFEQFKSKEVQRDLQVPRYTLRDEGAGGKGTGDKERGCVFMRWKEKFLVPDHRVKDINGASFAGFYYICVEYEPNKRLEGIGEPSSHAQADTEAGPGKETLDHHEGEPIPASMTGFYFHKHSEPNQELNLHHVPDEEMGMGNGDFEWR